MKPLTASEIDDALSGIPGWQLVAGELVRVLTLQSFAEAIAFVDAVASLAEAADHHPDIDIRFNRVRLALVTHDAGGITGRDLALARQVNQLPAAKSAPGSQ